MLEILQHTPTWVYITFFALLYLGLRACFTHEVNIRKSIVFPIIFIFLSATTFYTYPQPMLMGPVWGIAVLFGFLVSKLLFNQQNIKLGEKADTLIVPGDFFILLLLMFYFLLRYYLGYQAAIHGGVQGLSRMQVILFFASSGFICGFFIARTWLLRKCYLQQRAAATN